MQSCLQVSSSSSSSSSISPLTRSLYPVVIDLDDDDDDDDGSITDNSKFTKSLTNNYSNDFIALEFKRQYQLDKSKKVMAKIEKHKSKEATTTNRTTRWTKPNIRSSSVIYKDSNIICYPRVKPTFQELYVMTKQISKNHHISAINECIHRVTGNHYCVKVIHIDNDCKEVDQEIMNLMKIASRPDHNFNDNNVVTIFDVLMDYHDISRFFSFDAESSNLGNHIKLSKHTKVTPISKANGKIYIVMEYMDIGNLLSYVVHNRIRNNSNVDVDNYNRHNNSKKESSSGLPEYVVQNLTVQLICGIQYLHESCQMKHGNIHPSNILLSTAVSDDNDEECFIRRISGIQLKIADFGSSESYMKSIFSSKSTNTDTTFNSSSLISSTNKDDERNRVSKSGNYNFLPKLKEYSKKISNVDYEHLLTNILAEDMWDLGIVVYYMLAGHMPVGLKKQTRMTTTTKSHHQLTTTDGTSSNIKRNNNNTIRFPVHFSRYAKQFLCCCLQYDPTIRMTASEALEHIWLKDTYSDYVVDKITRLDDIKIQREMTRNIPLKLSKTMKRNNKIGNNNCHSQFFFKNLNDCSSVKTEKITNSIAITEKTFPDVHSMKRTHPAMNTFKQSWQYFMGSSTSSIECANTITNVQEDEDNLSETSTNSTASITSSVIDAATTPTSCRTIKVSNRNRFSLPFQRNSLVSSTNKLSHTTRNKHHDYAMPSKHDNGFIASNRSHRRTYSIP